jgi:hypothetical protein
MQRAYAACKPDPAGIDCLRSMAANHGKTKGRWFFLEQTRIFANTISLSR